ncbi:family 43 glycosylhydrolase [Echinimonas agarilytica]|uniref:Family 43 glycosylhydrolase n=1 Tax=Echinimonas agarilytica TaxID=1215918 RepID=A0AA42B803_9GAMM|nr:family 43 glycosylhydrolase [Echinimonas agarilytica]MCM2679928.1 family 43 glycosylhydrolase [Echinimonas agarilytica]
MAPISQSNQLTLYARLRSIKSTRLKTLCITLAYCVGALLPNAISAKNNDYQPLSTDQKRALIHDHSTAFQALNERIRDPFVHQGPDGYYYLTGTTAGQFWGETVGIKLWRSRDLAEWQDMGFVWELMKDGKQSNSWHFSQPPRAARNGQVQTNPIAIWAPEIHYLNGTWWIPHSTNVRGHGLLRSTSGKPEGPYEVLAPIERTGIDSHLYQENGQTYYMWGADWLVPMNDDMTGVTGKPFRLQHDGKHPLGYEGILMLKMGEFYVHIASGRYGYEPTDSYDLYYAISKNLEGPYGKRRKALTHAGHGNLIQGPNGQWWSTAFDHPYVNQWSLWLVPVEIEVTADDVVISSPDTRFQPSQDEQNVVADLSVTGRPEAWEGHAHWIRPEKLKANK